MSLPRLDSLLLLFANEHETHSRHTRLEFSKKKEHLPTLFALIGAAHIAAEPRQMYKRRRSDVGEGEGTYRSILITLLSAAEHTCHLCISVSMARLSGLKLPAKRDQ